MNENQICFEETVYNVEPILKGFEIFKKPSSNISFFGINKEYNQLFVQFKNGNSYLYREVKPEIIEQMPLAISIGKYFSQEVAGKFESTKYTHQLITIEGVLQ